MLPATWRTASAVPMFSATVFTCMGTVLIFMVEPGFNPARQDAAGGTTRLCEKAAVEITHIKVNREGQ
jgi:hypothetical protein